MAKTATCQVCGQLIEELLVTCYRNKPFVDGKTYDKMCWTCAHIPEIYHQTLDPETGELLEEIGPLLDYRYLETPETMVQFQFCDNLEEAKRSYKAVKKLIADVGVRELKKLKLTRPAMENVLLDYKYKKAAPANKRPKKVVKEEPPKPAVKKKAAKKVAFKKEESRTMSELSKFTRMELF